MSIIALESMFYSHKLILLVFILNKKAQKKVENKKRIKERSRRRLGVGKK